MRKCYGQGHGGFCLELPDLALARGEVVAVSGESGCGKSTLLDLLALVLRPSACEVFELGCGQHDINAIWNRRHERRLAELRRDWIGYVPQAGGLLAFLNARDNILLPLRLKGNRWHQPAVLEAADRLGIAACLKRKPRQLSGGQRQRVAVLRALAGEPALVLADEPTGAVDRNRALGILEDFRRLALERGVSVVLASHDLDLTRRFADRVLGFELRAASDGSTHSVCGLCG